MSAREWFEVALIAIAGTTGLLYVHQRDDALKAEGAEEIFHARADSLYLVAMDRESAVQALSTQENALIALRSAERDSAVARADRAEQRRPEVVERVVAAAGVDSAVVRAAVVEVVDSIQAQEIAPLRIALASADSVAASLTRERDAFAAANASLAAALEASRAAERAARAARPGWVARNLPKILVPLGVAGGWMMRGLIRG